MRPLPAAFYWSAFLLTHRDSGAILPVGKYGPAWQARPLKVQNKMTVLGIVPTFFIRSTTMALEEDL
jgi:hypothetical protein